jgi:two-component system phosphate regulon sensor histidine kinase PhoR
LILSAVVSLIFYGAIQNEQIASIKDRSNLLSGFINKGITDNYIDSAYYGALSATVFSGGGDSARVTLISNDGTVFFDNKVNAATLENHAGREEFIKAIDTGSGEATRYSTTLGSVTYYYAVRLDDGNVLRVSKQMSSIIGVFTSVLPAVILVTALILLLANFAARKLTAKIVMPLTAIDFEGGNTAVYDELLPYVHKIDEQKREIRSQITALKNRADTINAITENMKEGLILVDKTGVVLSANKSIAEIFRLDETVGKNILHICRDMAFQEALKSCLTGTSADIPFERGNKIYTVYMNPAYSGGEINGAIILFFDTTEKHKGEKQRREFSANVSHELKTPLTTISALSEMIGNGMAKPEDITGFALKISDQAKRLINIIDDIIKLSEFDEGEVPRDFAPFDVYELAASVVTALQERADEKQVQLHLLGEKTVVSGNKRMIDELLYNLIENGIKYNKPGGEVAVSISSGGGFCRISVADTGIGISQELQQRVFERFYRVDKSRSKRTGGTGLGLSIVKHIVEYHKGRIELESREGVGTKINCYIPF